MEAQLAQKSLTDNSTRFGAEFSAQLSFQCRRGRAEKDENLPHLGQPLSEPQKVGKGFLVPLVFQLPSCLEQMQPGCRVEKSTVKQNNFILRSRISFLRASRPLENLLDSVQRCPGIVCYKIVLQMFRCPPRPLEWR